MTTEQYSIGYEEGYQAGWNAAMDAKPAQQEPVATKLETQQFNCFHVSAEDFKKLATLPVGTKLYTAPPAQRKPLTDEEIESINVKFAGSRDLARLFARAIEAAHGITGEQHG